jgi:uncharacterized protein
LTGFYRDGCCNSDAHELGKHAICARVTEAFLQFSLAPGNDLISPRLEYEFPGLKPGDRWCLCAARWKETYAAGAAPCVVLEGTHVGALEVVTLEQLQAHEWRALH